MKVIDMNIDNIDIERLRNDLINYFGTAMINISFLALEDLNKVEKASNYELIMIAQENNFKIDNYIINRSNYKR